jgi:hypothetical protein
VRRSRVRFVLGISEGSESEGRDHDLTPAAYANDVAVTSPRYQER